MKRWNLFLAKHRFQTCMALGTMAQSGAQTSIFFFSMDISFLIKEEVEHAIGELSEAILVGPKAYHPSFDDDQLMKL